MHLHILQYRCETNSPIRVHHFQSNLLNQIRCKLSHYQWHDQLNKLTHSLENSWHGHTPTCQPLSVPEKNSFLQKLKYGKNSRHLPCSCELDQSTVDEFKWRLGLPNKFVSNFLPTKKAPRISELLFINLLFSFLCSCLFVRIFVGNMTTGKDKLT